MEKNYRDEGVNVYVTIEGVELPTGSYEITMLQKNRIPCILPLEVRCLDGEDIPYYQLNGMTEFNELKTRNAMAPRHIIRVLRDVLLAANEVAEYLLSVNNFVLDWEYIFRDEASGYFKFLYLPGYDKNLRSQLKGFLEKALKEMDHGDERETEFVYSLYDICAKDKFDLAGLANEIENFLGGKLTAAESLDEFSAIDLEGQVSDDALNGNSGATSAEMPKAAKQDKFKVFDEILAKEKAEEKRKLQRKESRKGKLKIGRSGKKPVGEGEGAKNESRTFILVIALSIFVLIAYGGMQIYRYGSIVEYKKLMALLVIVMAEIFVFMELSERRKQELALATAGGSVVPAPAENVVMQARINDELRDDIPRRSRRESGRRIRTEVEEDALDDQGSRWVTAREEGSDVRSKRTEDGRGRGVSKIANAPRDFDVDSSRNLKNARDEVGSSNEQYNGAPKDRIQETTILRDDSTTILYDSASARAQPVFALESTKGGTCKHFLTQPYTVFGRSTEVTCQIDNKTVSRVHARIFENGDDLMIEDMGSRNGTFINGCMISQGKSYLINEGDLVRFGNEEYRVLHDVM